METFGDALKRFRAGARLTQGELAQAAAWSQIRISRAETNQSLPGESMVERLDNLLKGGGQLIAAYQRASIPGSQLVAIEESSHWDVSEFMLGYISQLVAGRCTLREHRDLLVLSGWLTLLLSCLEYDLGNARQADFARIAANSLGKETGHGEIVGWSFELSSWFALTQGRLRSVSGYAEAGANAASHSSVIVQLAAQSAKAHARMGDKQKVHQILDDGFRLLAQHDHPARPENHFVIDPSKWDFYAMDCYRLARDDKRAAEHAHEVIELSLRPDGSEEARCVPPRLASLWR